MLQDNRTKPESEWTFYVVDHLPTMANQYYYDTVEEAMDKYNSLPKDSNSAIGSSIGGLHLIDHIHRRDGRNVLVTDCDRLSPWKEDPQIQESIDKMIAYLNVQHQSRFLFGVRYPSVIVDLERYSGNEIENYFQDKLLRPSDPKFLHSSVQEVYAEGEGWMKLDVFLKHLDDSRPGMPGEPAKNVFVDRLNINYIDETGRCGQADLSPRNYVLLFDKTAKEIASEKLAEDLYQFAADVDAYEAMDLEENKEEELLHMKQCLSQGITSDYTKFLTDLLSEGLPSKEGHKRALSLMARLSVLIPPEFRKRSLTSMIQNAEHKAMNQQKTAPQKSRNDMEH